MRIHNLQDWKEALNLVNPCPIEWVETQAGLSEAMPHGKPFYEIHIGETNIGFLTARPYYCDRGHFQVHIEMPDIDDADKFPRYYMSEAVARAETEAFLRWRLWKQRGGRE